MIDASKGFTLVRTFDVTAEEVWKAWTQPGRVASWLHPQGARTPLDAVNVVARPGQRYSYTTVDNRTGHTITTGGVYREVIPFSRLAFTWGDPSAAPEDSPLLVVTFAPGSDGTLMTFEVRGVEGWPGDGGLYDRWQRALASLGRYLARTPG